MTRRLRARLLVELDGEAITLVDEQLHLEQRLEPARAGDGMPWLDLFAGVVDVARRARDQFYSDGPLELAATDHERNLP